MSLHLKAQFDKLTTTRQQHVTGSAITLADAKGPIQLIVNPAATLAALAMTFTASPFDNQTVYVSFGGTMTAGTVVTSMTVVANAGQSVLEPAAPGTVAAGKTIAYRFNASNTKWYRLY